MSYILTIEVENLDTQEFDELSKEEAKELFDKITADLEAGKKIIVVGRRAYKAEQINSYEVIDNEDE